MTTAPTSLKRGDILRVENDDSGFPLLYEVTDNRSGLVSMTPLSRQAVFGPTGAGIQLDVPEPMLRAFTVYRTDKVDDSPVRRSRLVERVERVLPRESDTDMPAERPSAA